MIVNVKNANVIVIAAKSAKIVQTMFAQVVYVRNVNE